MPNAQNETESTGTPFDDVFKTEIEKMGHFLIPVIEEMFHVKATLVDRFEFERLANEQYLIDRTQNKISKKFSDSCFKISGKYYHIECQSTEDDSILFRLADYNFRIAIDNAENLKVNVNDTPTIQIILPHSGLIKLRGISSASFPSSPLSTSSSPTTLSTSSEHYYSQMQIIYRFQDQMITMPVPVMNVQSYSADEIYSKGLFFLIPFYAIRYEKRLRKILDTDDSEYDKIYSELQNYFEKLMEACTRGLLSEDDTRKLAELSKIILSHISRNLRSDRKERMVELVGGQVLELQEDRWLKQGRTEGIEQGRAEGRLEGTKSLLFSLVIDKVLNVSDAAKRAGESEADFTKELETYIKSQKQKQTQNQ